MRPIIVRPEEGREVCAFGDKIQFKVVGGQTGGEMTVGYATTPPGVGPPPHLHRNEHELFIIESGELEFFVEGEWTKAEPGSVVFLPKGVPHTFRNAGTVPSRMWVVVSPSGFEGFFDRCASIFAEGGEPDFGKVMEACEAHGIEILGGPPSG